MNKVLDLQRRDAHRGIGTLGSNWSWWACGENQPESSASLFAYAGG